MIFFQNLIRFLYCVILLFGLLFSTSFSKVVPFGDQFNLGIHIIVLINLIIHFRYLFRLRISFLILFFTFLSSFVNGFQGLRGGMILNFLTFSSIEIALLAHTFENQKAYFRINYWGFGTLLFVSVFCVLVGINSQPFTGMYMAQKVGGIPVQIWGLFSDKNLFGFTMMIFFLMTLLIPDFRFRKIILVVAFIFIILSGNRSGLVTTCVTLLFLFLINPGYSAGKKFSTTLIGIIFFALLVWLYLQSPLNSRGTESKDREGLYAIAFFFIQDNFWFGIGRALIVDGVMVHTHNLYIQVLAEEGFFCLLVYVVLFIKVLVKGTYSVKILCFSVFIFTGFNPLLVPGQLFTITGLIILGRYIDYQRAKVKDIIDPAPETESVLLNYST